jgi:hypothetical protein
MSEDVSEALTQVDWERAVQLIVKGRKGFSEESRWEDRELIRRCFKSITSSDLHSILAEFECSEKLVHRKESAQLLIAYFIWCKTENFGRVPIGADDAPKWPDNRKVDSYLWRFLVLAFGRMTGLGIEDGGFQGFDLPCWQSPKIAFFWSQYAGRPSCNHLNRDLAIVYYIERERRRGKHPWRAAREACSKFSEYPYNPLKIATVEKIVSQYNNLKDWRPLTETDDQLEHGISIGLAEAAERRTDKETSTD